jgi:hypothetical protein
MAKNPPRHKSAANAITAHSESVGTGGMAAEMVKAAVAATALERALVESAPIPIVFV